MVTKCSAAMISAAAVLSLGAGLATAGEAQATTYWRSVKFVHAGGQCLTIQGKASNSKGKREVIQKCNNGTSQAWRLVVGTYKGAQVTKISPAGNTSLCLDGAKSEKAGGEWYLHAVKCSNSTTQKWKYVRGDTQALWSAQNYSTKLCIAPRNKSKASGTWVVTTKCSGSTGSRQMLQSA